METLAPETTFDFKARISGFLIQETSTGKEPEFQGFLM